MPPMIDLTGKQFGLLKVLGRDEEKKGRYVFWLCECRCKKIVSVRGDHLKSGNTVSCGCKNDENIHKMQRNSIDITDKRFGHLVARYYVKSGKCGTIWHCECDCGGSIDTYAAYLSKGDVTSCGCLADKNREIQNKKLRSMIVDNTNIGIIKKTEPNKNSSTGIRGVSLCTSKQRYIAEISFQKRRYYLCSSADIEVCRAARKEAEKHLFGDFLEWYEKTRKN